MTHRSLALLVASCLVLMACRPEPEPGPPADVLLITLDTTRADRLAPYGFHDAPMPALERLAREGVLFEQAMSVAPLTVPAHASLLTGLFPPRHGVRDNAAAPLAASHRTLAETLAGRGFGTAAFVGAAVLAADRGLSQGFAHYSSGAAAAPGRLPMQRDAAAVVDEAVAWLEGTTAPRVFMWTHFYDAHRPYAPPEPFASRHAADPYVGEIAYVDAQIGRLLDAVDRRRRLDRTMVVVAGDHGESLGEHGERDHGVFVYQNVLRVPLIVRLPAVQPRRVPWVVRLVDVMPTVLAALDVPAPPGDGVSLLDHMAGTGRDLEAYGESEYPRRFGWSPLRVLRDGRFTLIEAPRPELYDLERDPFEERNLYLERRATADAMRARLATLAASAAPAAAASSEPVPADLRERLAALGYAGTAAASAPSPGVTLPDPKDCFSSPDTACGIPPVMSPSSPARPSARTRR